MSFSVYVDDPHRACADGDDRPSVRAVTLGGWTRTTAEHVLAEVFAFGEQGWYELSAVECRRRAADAVAAHDAGEREDAAEAWARVAELLDDVERRTGEAGLVSASW